MHTLHLTACPICGSKGSLIRHIPDQINQVRIGYTCQQCGSVLAWLGDDLWLNGDRWAYQRVGREDKRHLLQRPMTAAELHEIMDGASSQGFTPKAPGSLPEIIEHDTTALGEPLEEGDAILEPLAPAADPDRSFTRGAPPRPPRGEIPPARGQGSTALVPMAKILPEGMTLALVRYEGSEFVPVAILEEGQLRAIPARRRRGRGSPLLLISIGLTLLCLICSASAVILSPWLDQGLALMSSPQAFVVALPPDTPMPTPSPAPTGTPAPTATPQATETPLPTQTPLPIPTPFSLAVLEGVTDYVDGMGSHIILGEVFNTSDRHLRYVEVMAGFYDAKGQLVGTGSTFAELNTVEPGSSVPFRLATQILPASFDTYELHVAYSTTEEPPLRLRILNHRAFTADSGAYHVVGEVQDPYDFAVRFPQIVATYYNSASKIVRVEAVLTDADTLQPGQVSSFELILVDPPDDLSHYKLQTEAVQQ